MTDKKMVLKTDFSINQQTARNEGNRLMISPLLAGLHYFADDAAVFFKDINQKDEAVLGENKCKIFVRDIFQDEDMLIHEDYFQSHPEINIFILCKSKGGYYDYLGYVTRDLVNQTRIVEMIGDGAEAASGKIRRIFADQYTHINVLLPIMEEEKEEVIAITPQNFVHLHLHTEFSIGDAYGSCKQIAENLYKKGFKGAAITDHGTLAGVWEFQKALLEKNIKPVIGLEAYVKMAKEQEKPNHMVLFAKNSKGYENLLKLQALAARDNFYYHPIILFDDIVKYKEGLIISSGCSSGRIAKLIEEGKEDLAEVLATRFKEEFGEDLYFEIMLHNITTNQLVMQKKYALAKKLNIKPIITFDCHYPDYLDRRYHEAVKAINYKKKYGEAGYGDDCFFIMQDSDIDTKVQLPHLSWLADKLTELKTNTFDLFDKCNFQIQQSESQDTLPKLIPDAKQQEAILRQMVLDGLTKYTKYKYDGAIKDRIDLELDRIISKGYINYFLIVADMIQWAKSQGIRVGPGRGSVGASLVALCLNITEVDPIEHNLLFDRFLSVIRKDMPDVDMDFQDNRRQEVFDYLKRKYGENHCSKIVTYSRFHGKGIMRDIGRIFNISTPEIEKINSLIIERSGGDARASLSLTDTFNEFEKAKEFKSRYEIAVDVACKLEGAIRHKGVHAAAMTVTEKDLDTFVPLSRVNGEIVTEFEKQTCEDAGLIKFDILGLNTLTIINDCLATANITLPNKFDDIKVYETVFQSGKTLGVFQFNTTGITKLTQQLVPTEFSTLYDATSLYRPGALHSGQTMQYANRKTGKEKVEYLHALLEPITKKTLGVILYQEDIMQIMHSVGGLSWATSEMARKIMTKSKGKDAFNKIRDEFVRNAKALHGMPEEESNNLYDVVSTFGSYGFNKAHAVEYTILSYWCAWLKTYYPQHFYNAVLKHEQDESIIQQAINEAESLGYPVEYPEINKSSTTYTLVDGKIYAGFNAINGVAEKVAEKIIKGRPYISISDFKKKTKCSEKLFHALVIADCFRAFNKNRKAIINGADQPTLASFSNGVISKPVDDFTELEISQQILELTKLKPKMDIKALYDFGKYKFVDIGNINTEQANKVLLIRGIVTEKFNKDKLLRHELKDHQFTFEEHMFYLNINDGTGNIAAQINPATYEKYAELIDICKKQPIIILGRISSDGKKMYADLLQLVGKTDDIDKIFPLLKLCNEKEGVIVSAQPAVSKNKKSFYRLIINTRHEGQINGMAFQLTKKLYPGMKVWYDNHSPPFLKLEILG